MPVCSYMLTSTEPLVDYSKSIFFTSDAYLTQIELLATKRNNVAKSKDVRKLATEERKWKREEERILQVQKKKECDETKAHKAKETAYWDEVVAHG
jgi:hypothetical protein